MKCSRCGRETQGSYSEGGVLWAICENCYWKEQEELKRERKERRRGLRENGRLKRSDGKV